MKIHSMLIALLLFAFSARETHAAGQLDPSLGGGDGFVAIDYALGTSSFDQAYALLLQADGKIILGGTSEKGDGKSLDRDMVLVRLLPDGSLDSGFGIAGKRSIAFDLGGFGDLLEDLAHYPGGRIVGVGTAENTDGQGGIGHAGIVRLTANGTLDTSLNLSGKVAVPVVISSQERLALARAVAVQGDGRILVAGAAIIGSGAAAYVMRLNADGSLDTDFGTAGFVRVDVGDANPLFTLGTDLALRPDGRILLSGYARHDAGSGETFDMFAFQLNPDGSTDTSFGDNGMRLIAFDQGGDNGDAAARVALDPQGRAVLAGNASTSAQGTDFALVRLLANGSPDPDFGTGGRVLVGFDLGGENNDGAQGVAIDELGRIYAAGTASGIDGNADIAVLRLDAQGLPDPDYGVGGKVVFAIDSMPPTFVDETGYAVAIDSQQRTVAAGLVRTGPGSSAYDMLAVRLTSDTLFADGFEALP